MVEIMSFTLKQIGTTIQILPETNGDYLTLDSAAIEILKRDNSFVIEKIEIFLHGELLEVPDCLTQLRAKVGNAVIFDESLILKFNNALSNQVLEKMR